MKSKLPLLISGLVIIILTAVDFGSNHGAQAQDTTATPQTTYTIEDRALVQTGSLSEAVSATGTISPVREVTLAFQGQAVVTEILGAEGARVQAGDVIARIDSRSFDERLHDALVQLETAQIAYNDLTGPVRDVDLAAAEASVRAAQLALGPGTPIAGPDSVAAEIEAMELEMALNQNWQVQLRNEDFDPGLDAAWIRLLRQEEGTDEWEEARQDYFAAEARVILNQADVQSAERSVDVARAEYNAETERRPLYGGSSNAYAQLTEAEIALEDLVGPPDDYDLAYAQLDVAMAETNLQYVQELAQQAVLRAPFDGVIAELNLTQGAMPPANAVVLVDDSAYEMTVAVDELDIAAVDSGQSVTIELDALSGQTLSGVVDNVAMMPSVRGDVVTYNVRIALEAADMPVRSGMSGRARIATQSADNAIFVPTQFIRRVASLNAEVVVVLSDDGTFDLRPVTVGIQTGTNTQILSGVEAGESVVLLASSDLQSLVRGSTQSANQNQQ